ncbi:hypothetical protein GPROT1_00335 [Gammaproteobacteria bacterium]|nr:hypothetical protein GPROT1_00335 [Gammaproteobacteria bacterium]
MRFPRILRTLTLACVASLTCATAALNAAPTVAIWAYPNPALVGQTVRITISVRNDGVPASGSITVLEQMFSDGSVAFDLPLSAGVASYETSRRMPGQFRFSANYPGPVWPPRYPPDASLVLTVRAAEPSVPTASLPSQLVIAALLGIGGVIALRRHAA